MTSQVVYERGAFDNMLERAFKRIEGKVKTVIDAALADPTQREAAKSLVAQHIWQTHDSFTGVLADIEQPMVEVKSETLVATAEGVEKA